MTENPCLILIKVKQIHDETKKYQKLMTLYLALTVVSVLMCVLQYYWLLDFNPLVDKC